MASPIKLRKSCDVCATTKVGCGKEKPCCSRCAKRGLVCSYSAARRAGRTARTLSSGPYNSDSSSSPSLEISDPLSIDVYSGLFYNLGLQEQQSCMPADIPEQWLSHEQLGHSESQLTSQSEFTDLDSFFATMTGHPFGDIIHEKTTEGAGSLDPAEQAFGQGSLFPSTSHNSELSTAAGDQSLGGAIPHRSGPCRCFQQTASLSSWLTTHTSAAGHEDVASLSGLQSGLHKAQGALEQVKVILQCDCALDGDLLVALLLVLLKAISYYTSVAQASTSDLGEDEDDDDDEEQRLAARLILSSLMRVQVLVDCLSQRLGQSFGDENALSGRAPSPLVSKEMAHSLHIDLVRRLHALSRSIIEHLSQE